MLPLLPVHISVTNLNLPIMKHQFKAISFGRGNDTSVLRTEELTPYLAMIANFEQLSDDDEIELAHRIKRGDKKAKDALVNANLRAVVSIAKRYAYCGGSLTLCDLINEGNQGLIEAAETYDPTTGFKFLSYAVSYIRKYIILALKNKSRIVSDQNKDAPLYHTSLDAPAFDDDDTTIADTICISVDKEVQVSESLNTDLQRVLHTILQPKEITIVCTLYGIGTTQLSKSTIAEKLNKTEERIRQIAERAILKIRANQQAMELLTKYI